MHRCTAIVCVLVLAICVTRADKPSATHDPPADVDECPRPCDYWPVAAPAACPCDKTPSPQTRNPNAPRLDKLSPSFDAMADIATKPCDASTLSRLAYVYDVIAKTTPSSQPVAGLEAPSTAKFLRQTAKVIADIYANGYSKTGDQSGSLVFVDRRTQTRLLEDESNAPVNFNGTPLFKNADIEVSGMCLVNADSHVALVVFPGDSSPLRPPPSLGVRVVGLHVVHLVLIRGRPAFDDACPSLFRAVAFRARLRSRPRTPRVACAQWSDALRNWSSEFCVAVRGFGEVRCNCDTTRNGETTEYVVFEYVEDVDEFVTLERQPLRVTDPSDAAAMKSSIDLLGEVGSSAAPMGLETLINDVLFTAMQFDSAVLQNESSKAIYEGVGRIMRAVEPSDGSGVIGRGNQLLKSFVCDLDVYHGDPLVAFAFPTSNSGLADMEYFRSNEQVDYHRLFSKQMDFSFSFSNSVVQQNSRYAFILYPANKFFEAVAEVDGVSVLASRVLDVFLVARADRGDSEERLVHASFHPEGVDGAAETGCACWSAAEGAWTSEGCGHDPDLGRGVCTCDLDTCGDTRVTLASVAFACVGACEEVDVEGDVEEVAFAAFALSNLDSLYRGEASGLAALGVLNALLGASLRAGELPTRTATAAVQAVGLALVTGDGDLVDDHPEPCTSFHAVVGSTRHPRVDRDPDFVCLDERKASTLTVRLSRSLKQQNARYALLVHPVDVHVRRPPSVGKTIVRSHAFDVVLVSDGDDGVAQSVEVSIGRSELNASLGCAYWRDDLGSWTPDDCRVIDVAGRQVCNCTVPASLAQSRSLSQYIAYAAVAAVFDKKRYSEFTTRPAGDDADVDFYLGRDLLHNLTRVPYEDASLVKLLHIYLRLLSLGNPLLRRRQREMDAVLDDIAQLIGKYRLVGRKNLAEQFELPGTQRLLLKSGDVTTDLFSNPSLSTVDASNTTRTAGLSAVVLGHHVTADGRASRGFSLVDGVMSERVRMLDGAFADAALASDAALACLVEPVDALVRGRVVVVVLPVNLSPYPLTMTPSAVFNTRQLDAHVAADGVVTLSIHFRMTPAPKYYARKACAAWDAVDARWTSDLCATRTMLSRAGVDFVACRCNLTARPVTRVVLYEYTDLENFTFVSKFDGTAIVFYIGAIFALCGLGFVVATALKFPAWRDELDNKILTHLTASTLAHLALSTYRETHHVYTAANYTSARLLGYAVCVHYARLAHYAWGAVMSVLQYRRFYYSRADPSTSPYLHPLLCLLAWGAPAVPVGALLAWDPMGHFCVPDVVTHYVLHLAPVFGVLLLNVGLMAAVDLTVANGAGEWDDVEIRAWKLSRLKLAVFTCLVFGVPAACEVLHAFGGQSVALRYANKTLDALQGGFLGFFVVGYWRTWLYYQSLIDPEDLPMETRDGQ